MYRGADRNECSIPGHGRSDPGHRPRPPRPTPPRDALAGSPGSRHALRPAASGIDFQAWRKLRRPDVMRQTLCPVTCRWPFLPPLALLPRDLDGETLRSDPTAARVRPPTENRLQKTATGGVGKGRCRQNPAAVGAAAPDPLRRENPPTISPGPSGRCPRRAGLRRDGCRDSASGWSESCRTSAMNDTTISPLLHFDPIPLAVTRQEAGPGERKGKGDTTEPRRTAKRILARNGGRRRHGIGTPMGARRAST